MTEKITEEMKVHEAWFAEAKQQTAETLPTFINHLINDYEHDYGTICHALSAAALAGAYAVEHSPQGGITGFQSGAVMWGFVTHWLSLQGKPLALVQYQNMLYPQYREKFKSISKSTWEYLQKEARNKLATESEDANDLVVAHWRRIADGHIPFDFTLREERE